MTYNREVLDTINNVLDCLNFSAIREDTFNNERIEDLVDNSELPDGWEYNYGASKLVLYSPNCDFVIKIPFSCGEEWQDDDEEWHIDPLENAYLPKSEYCSWDYCAVEAEYYDLAEEWGVEKFFAPTRYFGDRDGWPIYLQEKVTILEDDDSRTHNYSQKKKTESKDKARSLGYNGYDIDIVFLVDLNENYSDEDLTQLFAFISEYKLDDFRSANVGYNKEGRPVFVDYSSFDS